MICESTGDFLRDTPADPELNSNFSCSYILTGQTDPWGDHYDTPPAGSLPPDPTNIMSYNGIRGCRDFFSRLQIAVMLHSIERGKSRHNREGWKNLKAEYDEYETDNDPLTARQILFGEVQSRNFHQQYTSEDMFGNPIWSQCDVDWVRFQPDCDQTFEIKTSAMTGRTNANTKITIYDAAMNQLAQNDDISVSDKFSKVALALASGQTYYIQVENMSSNITGYYNLSVTMPPITGNDKLCACETYSITGLPAGSSVTWSAAPSGIVSITPIGNTAQVCKLLNGNITLTATISGACGNGSISKQISVGEPGISGTYTDRNGQHPMQYWDISGGYNNVCNNYNAHTNMQIPEGSTVTWERLSASNQALTWSQSGNDVNFYFWAAGQTEVFRINVASPCVTTSYDFGFKSINCSGGGGGGGGGGGNPCDIFLLSPNPATSKIQVGVHPNIPAPCDNILQSQSTQQNKTASGAKTISTRNKSVQQVSIYNNNGTLLQQYQYGLNNKKATLNVSGLPAGTYLVRISDGNYSENHQVVIQ